MNTDMILLGSGPALQGLHCVFNLGLFLAPLAVTPFLHEDSDNSTGHGSLVQMIEDHGYSPIVIAYSMGGVFMLVASLVYFCVACALKSTSSPGGPQDSEPRTLSKPRSEKARHGIFALTLIYFFFSCAMEITYMTFLSTFAVQYMEWSDRRAVNLVTLLTLASLLGRFLGIFLVKCLGAKRLLCFSLVVCTLGLAPLYFVSESSTIAWVSSSIIGLSMATFYATTLTWTDENVALSARLTSMLIFMGTLGCVVAPFVQGLLFDFYGILSFLWLCTSELVGLLVLFVVLVVSVSCTQTHTRLVEPSAPPAEDFGEREQLLKT